MRMGHKRDAWIFKDRHEKNAHAARALHYLLNPMASLPTTRPTWSDGMFNYTRYYITKGGQDRIYKTYIGSIYGATLNNHRQQGKNARKCKVKYAMPAKETRHDPENENSIK